jgi:hypothetical protein
MTSEHDDLQTAILEAIDAIEGTTVLSSSITEENGVFYTSESQKAVTFTQTFSEPTRVSLWIYGGDGDKHWEGNNGQGYDSFRWSVVVNGHKYMSSSGTDYINMLTPYKHPYMKASLSDGSTGSAFNAYTKTAWLLVDDIPVRGEIKVTIEQTLDRVNSDGTSYDDPIVYQWLIG